MRAAEEKKLGDCSTIFGFFAFPGTTRLNFGPPAAPCKPQEPGRRPPAAPLQGGGGPTGFARVGGFAAGPAARLPHLPRTPIRPFAQPQKEPTTQRKNAMTLFINDYSEGCHERILETLTRTNREQTTGYGTDPYCEEARAILRREMNCPGADIRFLSGGTQTNLIAMTAALRPHEAVIGAASCHIFTHETGAIEATGHKVLVIPDDEGKVRPAGILAMLEEHDMAPHMVKPRVVFISQSTEVGTIYTREELQALHEVCRAHDLLLYADGARLGVGLTAKGCDVTLADMAKYCDFFCIGGTKNGALFGEALVLVNPVLHPDFLYIVKQRGGLFAKGRLLGIQFAELFRDGLYYELARHANEEAMRIKAALTALGARFQVDSPTNQQFIYLTAAQADALRQRVTVDEQWRRDNTVAVRICTGWATRPEATDALIAALQQTLQ